MTRTRAKKGQGDLLRAEILEVAERLLRDGGQEKVTIRGVTEALSISAPAVYLHFRSKDELVEAVCVRTWDGLGALMAAAAATSQDPLERLRLRASAYVGFGLENPLQYRQLMMSNTSSEPRDRAASVAVSQLKEDVVRCVQEGVFKGDPDRLTFALWAAAHGCVSLLVSQLAVSMLIRSDELIDDCIRMAGLGCLFLGRLPVDARGDSIALARGLDHLLAFAPASESGSGSR